MTQETLLTRIPQNTNFLQTTKFIFTIPNLPHLVYFTQSVVFPGVSTNEVSVETPFSNTYRHGDKLVYEPISITFLIDEDMRAWEETYNWLRALTFPHEFPEYIRSRDGRASPYHDAMLTMNNNSNLSNLRVHFRNCHPLSLSGITMSTSSSAQETPTATVVFRYDTFKIER